MITSGQFVRLFLVMIYRLNLKSGHVGSYRLIDFKSGSDEVKPKSLTKMKGKPFNRKLLDK